MTQSLKKLFTFDEFIEFLSTQPENIPYELYDGEYSGKQFRKDDCIESPTFPDLNLTAQQIFAASY